MGAALSNEPLGDLNPEVTDDINHAASVRLANLARDAGGVTLPVLVVPVVTTGPHRRAGNGERSPAPAHPVRDLQEVETERDVAWLADERFSYSDT
jgi:hypothetical protein